jgi:hypothetical protein
MPVRLQAAAFLSVMRLFMGSKAISQRKYSHQPPGNLRIQNHPGVFRCISPYPVKEGVPTTLMILLIQKKSTFNFVHTPTFGL